MSRTSSPNPAKRNDLTAPWWVILLILALAVPLSLVTRGDNILSIDREATGSVQRLDGQPWQGIADIGNLLGESTYAVAIALVLLLVAIARRDLRDVAFLCLLLVLRSATVVLKGIFGSPRPTIDVAEVVGTFDGFGFPSGHAVTSATALGGLAFLIFRHARLSAAACPAVQLLWLVGVLMTGYARIWYGAHWLTDVIGGSLVGLAIVLVSANLSALLNSWLKAPRGRPVEATRS